METINLKISKEFFDGAIPAAKEPHGKVFNKLKGKIDARIEDIADDRLGDVGINAVNNDTDGKLAKTLMSLASVDVLLHEMRGMDLVLTATGFGVVSTNDTAPASKMRVDALDGELRVKWLDLQDELLEQLFKLEGWYNQGLQIIDTVFCEFKFLRQFAGKQSPLARDWEEAAPAILSTDRMLRERIGEEYMEELITQMCTGTLSAPNKGIVHQLRRIIGAAIQGNQKTAYEYYRRLMNTLEGNLETFSTYANSEAYETNHTKPYENKQGDTAFHFVG